MTSRTELVVLDADASNWEDVEVKTTADEVKPDQGGGTVLADEDEWEDV